MVSRKSETLDLSHFQVGTEYSRPEIAEIGGVQPLTSSREWTGIVEFENCIVLFSTLIKDDLPPEHAYADVFSGSEFLWESQNQNTQNSPVILRLISLDSPVLLFCRMTNKTRGRATPFTYVGLLSAMDYDSERPVEFRFALLEFMDEPPPNLKELYDWRPGEVRKLKTLESPDRIPKVRKGQGRQADPRKRSAVEKRAMSVATAHYEKLGFTVVDTSANSPFDLECTNGEEVLRVEVKGLTGPLGDVEVTANEVRSARSPQIPTDLFIVHSITLTEHEKFHYIGENGNEHIESPWQPDDKNLEVTQYRYRPIL
jgi:hypothetical protein